MDELITYLRDLSPAVLIAVIVLGGIRALLSLLSNQQADTKNESSLIGLLAQTTAAYGQLQGSIEGLKVATTALTDTMTRLISDMPETIKRNSQGLASKLDERIGGLAGQIETNTKDLNSLKDLIIRQPGAITDNVTSALSTIMHDIHSQIEKAKHFTEGS